jgi:predicted nucleotidyltransferase
MTEDQNQDQEIELHDDENEIVEAQAHDPKNAEAQSVASVDKAGDATGTAPKRKGDNTKQDPMPKTKAALMAGMMGKLQAMTKQQLQAAYTEGFDVDEVEGEAIAETSDLEINVDFSDDLNALVAEEATLSDEFKGKAETIFEAAIKSKLAEEIDRLEEKYDEELAEEVATTKAELVEKVDSYLNYVVENWMEENKLAIQTGLRTEIAEGFMNNLKDLFTESYIEVPESKVDLVDELAESVEELETALNQTTARSIEMQGELEELQREKIVREHSSDLAETQVEKLMKLAEDLDFEDWDTFSTKVVQIKESYFTKKVTDTADIVEDDDGSDPVAVSSSMEQYLSAIKKTQK